MKAFAAAALLLFGGATISSPGPAAARRQQLPAAMRLPCPRTETDRVADLLARAEAGCTCETPELCAPVTKIHAKEVFGFGAGDNTSYGNIDWSQVTTIAWSTDIELVCTAHKHGARLVAAAPVGQIEATFAVLTTWVATVVAMVKALHIDGVTFDYESPIANGDPLSDKYTQIIAATTAALHEGIPGSQTSVCVAWSPNHIDGRYYDIQGFAAAADLLYIMMYDTRSQIFDVCLAGPNAALPLARLGVQQYLDLGVPAKQLILGVAWYGYDYGPEPPGAVKRPYRHPYSKSVCMALLYGRAGCLTVKMVVFGPCRVPVTGRNRPRDGPHRPFLPDQVCAIPRRELQRRSGRRAPVHVHGRPY
jgi:hypothetical protein